MARAGVAESTAVANWPASAESRLTARTAPASPPQSKNFSWLATNLSDSVANRVISDLAPLREATVLSVVVASAAGAFASGWGCGVVADGGGGATPAFMSDSIKSCLASVTRWMSRHLPIKRRLRSRFKKSGGDAALHGRCSARRMLGITGRPDPAG